MNFSRSMILWVTVLTLSGILGVMPSVLADEDERTTAKDVVDSKTDMEYQDNLKKFVLSASDYFLGLPLSELLATFKDILQEEGGDWNYKSMYLVVLFPDGTVYSHGEDPSKDNKDISDAVDDNGKEVVKEILAVVDADEEGGFVEYTWDDPATDEDMNPRYCYAIKGGHPDYPVQEFILVGGYHHNVTSMADESEDLPELPEVSAMDVRDRETLKAFVQAAGDWALAALPTLGFDLPELETIFRVEGGHWRSGSTYMFLMTLDGTVLFHGARPDQEQQIQIDLEDRNGFQFVRALVEKAMEGGGYVEYYWNDPGVEGDEEFGSAKVGYAQTFPVPDNFPPQFAGQTVVAGSGFYKGNQVSLDFAHFANGGGITSDIVLLNAASKPVRPAIYFYGEDGVLIEPESVMDVPDDMEVTSYGALTVLTEIPSLGEVTISTHGRGEQPEVGSVKVVSDAPDSPLGGVLRFDLVGTGVAGVGASQPVRDAIFPVRRVDGGINTGAAFRNLSESDMELTCRLMMGGDVLEEQPVDLPANGQKPRFIDEIFNETDMSDFTGSVRCTAPPGDQHFTAVALELEKGKVFTTLPVIPVAQDMMTSEE